MSKTLEELNLEMVGARGAIVGEGRIDDTQLTLAEMEKKAPFYVYRMLSGAAITHENDTVSVRSCGQTFVASKKQFALIEQVYNRVFKETMEPNGIALNGRWNVEDEIRIFNDGAQKANIEFKIPPEKLRVLYLRMDDKGCGFYRVMQPVKWLERLEHSNETPIHVEETAFLNSTMCSSLDVIVCPRICSSQTISILKYVQRLGKQIVYETDDLMSNIPNWNPVTDRITPEQTERREFFMNVANACVVSTEELKTALKRGGVHVVHNGIDAEYWPMTIAPQNAEGPVRIMWAGSDTHEKDLSSIIKPIKNMIRKYKNKVHFIFVNYLPEEFKVLGRKGGMISDFVKPEYQPNVFHVPGSTVLKWPSHLASFMPNICIAPLIKHPFNECKSEIKVLESWALGVPIIATSIAPYDRAITQDKDGVLCDSEDSWEVWLDRLISRPDERTRLATAGLETLKNRYVMSKVVHESELALLKIADGHVNRPECQAAITKRLSELGA